MSGTVRNEHCSSRSWRKQKDVAFGMKNEDRTMLQQSLLRYVGGRIEKQMTPPPSDTMNCPRFRYQIHLSIHELEIEKVNNMNYVNSIFVKLA